MHKCYSNLKRWKGFDNRPGQLLRAAADFSAFLVQNHMACAGGSDLS
jgi:hypothetical protein